jgi:uncharacterized membrane protein
MNTSKKRKSSRTPSKDKPELAGVVRENIGSLIAVRDAAEKKKSFQNKLADLLTRFSGSMMFVYVHTVWFGLWIYINTSLLRNNPFDPFPFSLLTLIVSLEAIFLSTFVLISQNHAAQVADKRADLDLQINLLSEHEVTRLLTIMDALANHLGIDVPEKPHVEELKKDVDAKEVLDEIESHEPAKTKKL